MYAIIAQYKQSFHISLRDTRGTIYGAQCTFLYDSFLYSTYQPVFRYSFKEGMFLFENVNANYNSSIVRELLLSDPIIYSLLKEVK
jgi:hypothetical protein